MDLNIIINKMNKLKNLDKDKLIFGADSHNYILGEKLTEDELINYEKKYNLVIPTEYRIFLSTIGDGGFGPFYGLLPLLDNDDCTPILEKEFPLTKDRPLKLYNLMNEMCNKYSEVDSEEQLELLHEKDEKILDKLFEDVSCGVKFICHEGCGMYSILIIKGEEAGTVWFFDFCNDYGVFPIINTETNKTMSFLEWYNVWLDKSLEAFEGEDLEEGEIDDIVWSYSEYISDQGN